MIVKGKPSLLTKTLAQEVASRGIRVNANAPGGVSRAARLTCVKDGGGARAAAAPHSLRPHGEPEDVAKVAVWLASNESDYVIGTTIFVDGGTSLYLEFRDNG